MIEGSGTTIPSKSCIPKEYATCGGCGLFGRIITLLASCFVEDDVAPTEVATAIASVDALPEFEADDTALSPDATSSAVSFKGWRLVAAGGYGVNRSGGNTWRSRLCRRFLASSLRWCAFCRFRCSLQRLWAAPDVLTARSFTHLPVL
ncbi:hypothetical protein PsorP6_011542 [Peronosclerospora sorghi]|uniref:Uncharacterized protein n=1 Tax=Peronosclerospora sorghi TaxID=230839 RepID=A0ACC0WKI6_9STRA|nr:hypothetical protein PsorP6_011542 [Peronosclerospora sorghi]